MQQSIRLRTRKKFEVVDLTREVAAVVAEARVDEGIWGGSAEARRGLRQGSRGAAVQPAPRPAHQ